MTYEDFLLAFANTQRPQGWRKGQLAFNLLCDIHPTLADKVRGTSNDPFYRDNRIPDFLMFVQRHWDDFVCEFPRD